MVAVSVSGLVFCGDLGETEGTPVGVSANDTAGADDLGTGITGDPRAKESVFGREEDDDRSDVGSNVLSHLVEAARADLFTAHVSRIQTIW